MATLSPITHIPKLTMMAQKLLPAPLRKIYIGLSALAVDNRGNH